MLILFSCLNFAEDSFKANFIDLNSDCNALTHTDPPTHLTSIMWLTEPRNRDSHNGDKSKAEDVRGEILVMTMAVLMASHIRPKAA